MKYFYKFKQAWNKSLSIRIIATTVSVVRSKVESIEPNALKRSPSSPPGPVT